MRERPTAASSVLFPGPLRALRPVLIAFVAFNALVRVGLAVFNGDASLLAPWRLGPALAIGLVFDAAVATFLAAPLAIGLAAWPRRFERALRWAFPAFLVPVCAAIAFVGAAEFTFWNEFASRFNFIAVDYLVYTNEVIGNIRESYDLPLLLSGVAAVAAVLWLAVAWRVRRAVDAPAPAPGRRAIAAAVALWVAAPVVAWAGLDARYHEFSSDGQLNELAGNGWYEFCHAFWQNEIDYDRFYRTLPRERALAQLAKELAGGRPVVEVSQRPFEREIVNPGPERRLNVVLVSVESLSAEFLGAYGDRRGLTPNLDRLAQDSLVFTHVYATGTRTVRGLEALSLSIPPTPGHAIVKRPDNANLFTLGEVFHEKGYEPLFVYGGYGYFDNMNAFFGGNGYTVVDRTALSADQIHFENVWGVADEDLFALALRQLDARHAEGKRFFAHVMTTSNHRPFTYPEGRIDIPPRKGRAGGVKYTDFAIGQFIEEARKRPWFADTVFVIVADHTHKARGRTDLPIDNYLIPLLVYAPGHVAPGRVDTIASQIDVGPTILGLLGFSYPSKFFGQDILRDGPSHPRAFLSNYQTVGYYEDGAVVELKPKGRWRVVDAQTGQELPAGTRGERLRDEAISYYQIAADAYQRGDLKISLR